MYNYIPTAPSGPPLEVVAVVLNPNTIRLSWSPPSNNHLNGVIRSYSINVTELPTGDFREFTAPANDHELMLIVQQLHPFYTYECTVAAFTVGLGPAAHVNVITDPAGR